jgi:cytochrome c-type biogenesis protein CcmH
MLFIVIAGVMLCVAAACVVVPLWRHHSSSAPSYEIAYRSEHANQVNELARDLAAGRLAAVDHAAARRDLERELATGLKTAGAQARLPRSVGSRNRILAVTAGVILLASMAVGYWQLGNWRVAVEGVPAASVHRMEEMVTRLSKRLHTTDPNDLKGWTMLGQAYMLMGRYGDAVEALGRAHGLAGDSDPDLLAAYAQAVALADPDEFMQKAAPLFEKVLQIDPNNTQALWYGGLAALNNGDKKLAVQRWRLLLAQNLSPDNQAIVKQSIQNAGGSESAATSPVKVNSITVHVALDPKLLKQVSPEDTVFVYAEPAGSQNGPPLAVRRFKVKDLPLSITLSDKDAMAQGRNISDFSDITLVARISRTGNPIPQAGDFEGKATWNRGDGHKVMTIQIKS